jgi:hypothetical protein
MICPVCLEEHKNITEVKYCFDKLARIIGNQFLMDGKIDSEYKKAAKKIKIYLAEFKRAKL